MKKSSVLIILLVFISLSLGGFIIYDKVIMKGNANNQSGYQKECEICNNANTISHYTDFDIKNLLDFVIFKRDSNSRIIGYDVSDLDAQDINYIVYKFIIGNGVLHMTEKELGFIEAYWELDSNIVDKAVKELTGKEVDITKGLSGFYSEISTLTKEGNNYKLIKNSDYFKHYLLPIDVNGTTLGDIDNIEYKKDGNLILEVKVNEWLFESNECSVLGTAELTFNVKGGIRFKSFNFIGAEEIYPCN